MFDPKNEKNGKEDNETTTYDKDSPIVGPIITI